MPQPDEISINMSDRRFSIMDYIMIPPTCVNCVSVVLFIIGIIDVVTQISIIVITVLYMINMRVIFKARVIVSAQACAVFRILLFVNGHLHKRFDLLTDNCMTGMSVSEDGVVSHRTSLIVYNSDGLTRMYKNGDRARDTFMDTTGTRLSNLMWPDRPIGEIMLISKRPLYTMIGIDPKKKEVFIEGFMMDMDVITIPVDIRSGDPRFVINECELDRMVKMDDELIRERTWDEQIREWDERTRELGSHEES